MRPSVPTEKPLPFKLYLMVAFVEGAAVMACELLGARMIAPYFGTTLFVWSSVIGVTLAGLAVGYCAGGYLADRFTGNKLLFWAIGVAAVLVGLMPLSAKLVMQATIDLGLRLGSLVSCATFLLFPLAALGMTSPILVRLAARDLSHAGRASGAVYASSTVSGILATFLLGFYLIPVWGITWTVMATALLLGALPLLYWLASGRFAPAAALLGLSALGVFFTNRQSSVDNHANFHVLYRSAGLLGEVVVADFRVPNQEPPEFRRVLFVNRQPQTAVNRETGICIWPYAHSISTLASIKPRGSRALVLGLGGGSLANEFVALGFQVDACELDARIANAARAYFKVDARCRIVIDDARHYIRGCQARYDVVVLDVFVGEQPPSHLLTVETFRELKRALGGDGLLLINFNGFLSGDAGLASRSVLKTMAAAGFNPGVVATPGPETTRNLIFVASVRPQNFAGLSADRQNHCCREIGKVSLPLSPLPWTDLADALALRDDQPMLDLISLRANETWRRDVMKDQSKLFQGLGFF